MSVADSSDGSNVPDHRWFTSTHWSVILAARGTDSPQALAALESLCRIYWQPLCTFLRRRGAGPDDAHDLTQSFFAYLLEKDILARADRDRGKFRSFLLTCLRNFANRERIKADAIKRGGRVHFVSLDDDAAKESYSDQSVDNLTPEKAFDRAWALKVLEQVVEQLRREAAADGKAEWFECLQGFLASSEGATPYAELSQQLGLSQIALRSAVHRLRQRYREVLRHTVAHTVATPADIDDEIRYLISVVAE